MMPLLLLPSITICDSSSNGTACVVARGGCVDAAAWERQDVRPRRSWQLRLASTPHWSDRYSVAIECGGVTWLFSRRGGTIKHPARSRMDDLLVWHTIVRRRIPHSAGSSSSPEDYGPAQLALHSSLVMSHNAVRASRATCLQHARSHTRRHDLCYDADALHEL